MTAAIFGLLGVVVGGVLNAYIAMAAERRRDRAEARAVTRLLHRELTSALSAVREWLDTGGTSQPSRDDALRFPAWARYHLSVARCLPTTEWMTVSNAYLALYRVRTRDDFEGPLAGEARGGLEAVETAVVGALQSLDRVALHARERISSRLAFADEGP